MAVSAVLTHCYRWSALHAWEMTIASDGDKKAVVAGADKLAIVLYTTWRDGAEFH
jgi:hypothetical protein